MKKGKKAFTVLIFMTAIGHIARPQAAIVYDPTNYAEMVKTSISSGQTVANTASMVSSLTTTIGYLKDAEEFLKQINAGLETMIWTKRVYQRQVDLVRMQYEISVKAQKLTSLSPEELQRLNNQLLLVVQEAQQILGMANDILTTGKFKMNDADRLKNLKELDKHLSFQQTVMKIQYMQAKVIDEERQTTKAYRMVN